VLKMFTALLEDINLLRDSIATISELIDEGLFKIKKTGIELLASDRAVVAVVDFNLNAKNFKEYNYDSDASFGLNLNDFLQVLRRAKPNDILSIKLDENRIELTFKNDSVRRFTIPIIEIREEIPVGVDKLAFPVQINLKSEILSDGIDDADLVSDSVIFDINKERVIMKAQGDSNSSELKIAKESEGLIKLDGEKEVRARYSLDYLKKMIKARKLSDTVNLFIDSNYPLKLVFSTPEKISMSFILAPRIEEE